MKEGVRAEAKAQLQHTLREMLTIYQDTADDDRVLTVRSESLLFNYDATVHRILQHVMPHLDPTEQQFAVQFGATQDLRRCTSLATDERELGEKHRLNGTLTATIEGLIAERDPVMVGVLKVRQQLGYSKSISPRPRCRAPPS
eukprot:1276244-Amphidinium_carterae.1